ncbi:MAG: hypothetical protein JWQ23_2971 [Herminiimonas sp.]|jgi:hypothetical protein|nr:hypothetical protein [Herminiimonas sp.]
MDNKQLLGRLEQLQDQYDNMEAHVQLLHGSFVAISAACSALVATHPERPAVKRILADLKDELFVTMLSSSASDDAIEAYEDLLDMFDRAGGESDAATEAN